MFRRLSFAAPVAAIALAAFAGPAAAGPGSYHVALSATFKVSVPKDALKNGWCYDVGLADPATHSFYLADAANKQITAINPATGAVSAIGAGAFSGIAGCHKNNFNGMGPNGLAIYGGVIYAGNGNSRVLGYSLSTGRRVADYNTGGKLQADELTVAGRYLVVSNSAETPYPYITLIDLRAHKIVARYQFTGATGGLGQIGWWDGHLYVAVATSTASPKGGEVDELDISHVHSIRVVRTFRFAACQPAGLAIDAGGLAAIGCGPAAGPVQEILNVRTGKQVTVKGLTGVDIVAAYQGDFFYVSFISGNFMVAGASGQVLQNLAVNASHTVAVDPSDGDVWLPMATDTVTLYTPAR